MISVIVVTTNYYERKKFSMIKKLIAIPIGFVGIGIIVLGVLIEGLAEMILSAGEEQD